LLLKSYDRHRWREQLIDVRWLHKNEDLAHRKINSCNKNVGLRKGLVEFLCKVKGKWPNEVTKLCKIWMKLAEVRTRYKI
jgi:hypothetical protein